MSYLNMEIFQPAMLVYQRGIKFGYMEGVPQTDP